MASNCRSSAGSSGPGTGALSRRPDDITALVIDIGNAPEQRV